MDMAQKAGLAARLLTVRSEVAKIFLPLAAALPERIVPASSWLERELLPTLALLPALHNAAADAARAEKLALALELSFLAGRLHDNAAAAGVSGRAILAGDFLYARSALTLTESGFDAWLGKVGRVLARRSEARRERLDWRERAFVPEEEKLAALPKENAEGVSLAAAMAAEAAGLPPEAAEAYAGFGFYLGVLQGVCLNGYSRGAAYREAYAQAEQALARLAEPPRLAEAAERLLLSRFAAAGQNVRSRDVAAR